MLNLLLHDDPGAILKAVFVTVFIALLSYWSLTHISGYELMALLAGTFTAMGLSAITAEGFLRERIDGIQDYHGKGFTSKELVQYKYWLYAVHGLSAAIVLCLIAYFGHRFYTIFFF